MNANQNLNKAINVFGFSICGIGGFQSVVAGDSSTVKRMSSAINHIDRKLKTLSKALTLKVNDATRTAGLKIDQDKLSAVNFALMISKTVKDQLPAPGGQEVLKANDKPNLTLSTEEFFKLENNILDSNVELFIEKAKEIDVGIDKHIKSHHLDEKQIAPEDLIPYLYLCTGSFFGEVHYPIVMTNYFVNESGGDFVVAARKCAMRALCSAKSFRLTDYLRGANCEKAQYSIDRLDKFMDTIDEVKVTKSVALLGGATPQVRVKELPDFIRKATSGMIADMQLRLLLLATQVTTHPSNYALETDQDKAD